MPPRVSIIVALFRADEALDGFLERLDTLLVPGVEAIVVDDASGDGTGERISAWAASRPGATVLLNEQNRGVAASRNRALAAATGEFVWFVDHDDEWRADILETLVDAASADAQDIVVCRAALRVGGRDVRIVDGVAEPAQTDGRGLIELMLRGEVHGFLWSKLFRREVLGADPFPIQTTQSDFVGVVNAAARAARVRLIPDTLYAYVVRPDSLTRTRTPDFENIERAHAAMTEAARVVAVEDRLLLDGFTAWFYALAVLTVPIRWNSPADVRRRGARLAREVVKGLPLWKLSRGRPRLVLLIANRISPPLAGAVIRTGYRLLDARRASSLD
jgi:hypothetical protein